VQSHAGSVVYKQRQYRERASRKAHVTSILNKSLARQWNLGTLPLHLVKQYFISSLHLNPTNFTRRRRYILPYTHTLERKKEDLRRQNRFGKKEIWLRSEGMVTRRLSRWCRVRTLHWNVEEEEEEEEEGEEEEEEEEEEEGKARWKWNSLTLASITGADDKRKLDALASDDRHFSMIRYVVTPRFFRVL